MSHDSIEKFGPDGIQDISLCLGKLKNPCRASMTHFFQERKISSGKGFSQLYDIVCLGPDGQETGMLCVLHGGKLCMALCPLGNSESDVKSVVNE